jgi:uncharacterized protein (TIGR03435 family)
MVSTPPTLPASIASERLLPMRLPLVLFASSALFGQSAEAPPQFEAASLKPSTTDLRTLNGGPGSPDPIRWTASAIPLFDLICRAYNLHVYQLAGPEWLKQQRFDVAAKLAKQTTGYQFALMLQNLLATRLRLTVHWERKEMPVLALVIARNGPRLQTWAGDAAPSPAPARRTQEVDADGYPILPDDSTSIRLVVRGHVSQRLAGFGMSRLVGLLEPQIERPVIDRTGLTGQYTFVLHYVTGSAANRGDGPTLSEAMSQLGLRLENTKAHIDTLVVDSAAKSPVDN